MNKMTEKKRVYKIIEPEANDKTIEMNLVLVAILMR